MKERRPAFDLRIRPDDKAPRPRRGGQRAIVEAVRIGTGRSALSSEDRKKVIEIIQKRAEMAGIVPGALVRTRRGVPSNNPTFELKRIEGEIGVVQKVNDPNAQETRYPLDALLLVKSVKKSTTLNT